MPKTSTKGSKIRRESRWRENHGNFLLLVTGLIVISGLTIIACRQSRFSPPGFPSNILPPASDSFFEESSEEMEGRQVISVRVIGAASDRGSMRLAVYTSPEGFNDPEQALGVDSWRIIDGICEGRFGLPEEIQELAIAAFHDENENGLLDRNLLGIPSERYGFTNNARGTTGPPTYEEALVPITEGPIEISIR